MTAHLRWFGRAVGLVAIVLGLIAPAFAGDTYVRGHIRKDGTYVQPHYRSAPDGNVWNNYSTSGNVNPYTGKPGHVNLFNSGNQGLSGFGNQGLGGRNDRDLSGWGNRGLYGR
ncbi:MAG: hypothetical protein ACREM3_09630 [Candidatus Rokuibacteriota bacterium]